MMLEDAVLAKKKLWRREGVLADGRGVVRSG